MLALLFHLRRVGGKSLTLFLHDATLVPSLGHDSGTLLNDIVAHAHVVDSDCRTVGSQRDTGVYDTVDLIEHALDTTDADSTRHALDNQYASVVVLIFV